MSRRRGERWGVVSSRYMQAILVLNVKKDNGSPRGRGTRRIEMQHVADKKHSRAPRQWTTMMIAMMSWPLTLTVLHQHDMTCECLLAISYGESFQSGGPRIVKADASN